MSYPDQTDYIILYHIFFLLLKEFEASLKTGDFRVLLRKQAIFVCRIIE